MDTPQESKESNQPNVWLLNLMDNFQFFMDHKQKIAKAINEYFSNDGVCMPSLKPHERTLLAADLVQWVTTRDYV